TGGKPRAETARNPRNPKSPRNRKNPRSQRSPKNPRNPIPNQIPQRNQRSPPLPKKNNLRLNWNESKKRWSPVFVASRLRPSAPLGVTPSRDEMLGAGLFTVFL